LRNLNVVQIASGGKHIAVLTSNGKLYVCGTHILGLLGIDNKEYKDFSIFQKLTTLDHEFITHVECAEFHTLCLTNTGQVYAWGGSLHKVLSI
jgi:alpha-tubulin suppressor-like RCC1 family protein